MTEENRHTITPFIDWLIDSKLDTEPTQLYSHMEDYLKQLKASKEEVVKINIALGDVSGYPHKCDFKHIDNFSDRMECKCGKRV